MNRRNFFRTMIGGVAAAAAVRTFPFRVFSFPTEVVPAFPALLAPELATIYYSKDALRQLVKELQFREVRAFRGNFTAIGHPIVFKQYQMMGIQ